MEVLEQAYVVSPYGDDRGFSYRRRCIKRMWKL